MLTAEEITPVEITDDGAFCDGCLRDFAKGEFTWHSIREKNLVFCSLACYQKYIQIKSEWSGKNINEFINHFYPREERKQVKIVNLTDLNLTGELDPNEFAYQTIFITEGNPRLITKEKIILASEWLDYWYPLEGTCLRNIVANGNRAWKEGEEKLYSNFGKTRAQITHLDISSENLKGELDLTDFVNLEELRFRRNQITNLIFSFSNQKITKIEAFDNKLTSLNFLTLLPNPEQAKAIGVFQNQIVSDNLEFLAPFVNCEKLSIGKNRVHGNLSSLRFWTKLRRLDISHVSPQIEGLEYIAHNPFDGVEDNEGIFFQDYVPRNIEEFNIWRYSDVSFRKLADEKLRETISILQKELEQKRIQYSPTRLNNFLSSLNQEQFIQFLKVRSNDQLPSLLDHYQQAKELLSLRPNNIAAQNAFQQARKQLATAISNEELTALERYQQTENNEYIEQNTLTTYSAVMTRLFEE